MKKGEMITVYIQTVVEMLTKNPRAAITAEDVLSIILFWRIIGKILKGTNYWQDGAVRVWSEPIALSTVANPMDVFISKIQDLRNEFIAGGAGRWEKHFSECELALQNYVVEFRRQLKNQKASKDGDFRHELIRRF